MTLLIKHLRWLYLVFVLSVTGVLFLSQVIIQRSLELEKQDASRINMAGRQRMLSQSIVKTALLLHGNVETPFGESPQNKLDSLSNLMRDSHDRLRYGSQEPFFGISESDSIKQALDAILLTQNALISATQDLRTNLMLPEKARFESMAAILRLDPMYVRQMDDIVSQMELESAASLSRLQKQEIYLSLLAGSLLLFELIFIIIPVIYRLKKSNEQYREMNEHISQQEEENLQSVEEILALKEQIGETERMYQNLVEQAVDMIYELDEEGRFSYVNQAMVHKIGIDVFELTKLSYYDLVHPDFKERLIEFYNQQLRERGSNSYFEFLMRTPSGEEIWVGQQVTIVYENDRLRLVRAVARDIGQLVETRKKLKDSRKRYKLLSEYSKDVIALQDATGAYTFLSPSVRELVGYGPEEILGRKTTEFTHPDDADMLMELISRLHKEKAKWINFFRYRLRHKAGYYVWVESSGRFIYDEAGNLTSIQTTTRDISMQVKAEKDLRISEDNLHALIENTTDAIWSVGRDFKLISFNSVFKTLAKVLVNKPVKVGEEIPMHLFGRSLEKQWKPALERAFRGERFTEEVTLQNEGKDLVLELSFNPIINHYAEVSGAALFAKDISARKRDENVLLQAKNRAELANKAKEQFLSTMSHEMRTPMNAIIGLTHILLQENPRGDQLENLELIRFNGESLLSLINDVLDFNKIESGTLELEEIGYDLRELVESIIRSHEFMAIEKQLELESRVEEEVPQYLMGDPTRVAQVLNNLISNAIKFTEKGYVRLTVCLSELAQSPTLEFSISDTGIGIPDDKLQLIFDRFTQVDPAITRKYGGTGLGLSITRYLLQMMDGEIHVESFKGKGSTFLFTLPSIPASSKAEGNFIISDKGFHDLSELNMHVLLVEDNKANRFVATKFLQKWGVRVSYAYNGLIALEMIQKKVYDLVLMDLQMPELDGYQAAQAIRDVVDDQYYQNIPILALTASALADVGSKVQAVGMNDVITKPFNPLELNLKLIRYYQSQLPGKSEQQNHAEHLEVYSNGDESFRLEMITIALEEIEQFRDEYKELLPAREPEPLKKLHHRMKPTFEMLHITEPSELIKKTIEQLDDLSATEMSVLAQAMQDVCDQLMVDLRAAEKSTN